MKTAAAALTLAVTLAACGSTVATSAQLRSGTATADPIGLPAPAVTPSAMTVPSGPSRALATAHLDASGAPTVTTAGAEVPTYRGVGRHVVVGVDYSADYEKTMASLGFSGLASGDIPALVRTIVADINAKGGLLGATVDVVFHNTSTADSQSDPSSAAQAVCADFLQDHHVDLVLTPSAVLTDCFEQHKVLLAQYAAVTPNGADRAFLGPREPYLFAPTSFETDELYPLYLDRLAAEGYFPAGAQVGVLWSSQPSERRQSASLLSLLATRGVHVASTFEYDATNAASITSSVSSSVLRFRAAGVDHVISLDGNVGLFMIQAEQQKYRPRYAMNTFMGPTSVQQALVPAAQLHGAVGVGWEPVNDVDATHDDVRSAARSACDASVTRSGQNLSGKPTARFAAYSICDSLRLLVEGAARAGTLDPVALRVALARLGTGFPTALDLLSAYGPHTSAGAAAVRDLAYDDTCACFRYTSKELFS